MDPQTPGPTPAPCVNRSHVGTRLRLAGGCSTVGLRLEVNTWPESEQSGSSPALEGRRPAPLPVRHMTSGEPFLLEPRSSYPQNGEMAPG